jgi:hypothetical protein
LFIKRNINKEIKEKKKEKKKRKKAKITIDFLPSYPLSLFSPPPLSSLLFFLSSLFKKYKIK